MLLCGGKRSCLHHLSKTSFGIISSSMGPTFSQGRTPTWACSASTCLLCNEQLSHHLSYQSSLSVRRRNSRLVAVYKVVYNLSPVPVGKLRPCSHQTISYDPLTVTFTPFAPRTNYYKYSFSPLSVRRRNSRLVAVYKVVYNLSPVPVGKLRPCSHQTRSYDPLTVTFTPFAPRTNYYKYSFSPRIVVDWNSLLFSLRAKLSVESFRAGLQHFIISTSSHWTEPQHSSRNGPRPYSTELPKYGSTTPKECRYLLNYLVKSKGKHQETKR